MVNFRSFRDTVLSTLGLSRPAPDIEALRELCLSLLDDVPSADAKAMLVRLERMRRADDMWHLRGALFDTIARTHGETEARARLAILDERMR